MKILILGAGRVGTSVAENLVSEQNDITLIDTDPARLAGLQERLDLRTIAGNGTWVSVLEAAGAGDADMLIACATDDATNLVACKIARQVFNIPQRIARIRSSEFLDTPELTGEDGFCVDHLISPERSVTTYLQSLIEFPEALQVVEFADGQVSLVVARAAAGSPLVRHSISELSEHLPHINAHILAIYRHDRPIDPTPRTTIEAGDEVFFLVATRHARQAIRELRQAEPAAHRIMIAGGGNIGLRLARSLADDGYAVKIVEYTMARCEFLSTQLPSNVLVLQGDATDEVLLEDEHVADTDVFLALTNNDEDNIMSALLAKRMGAHRVMALIGRKSYGELMEGSRIDVAVAPDQSTIGELLRYVRRGDIVAVQKLRRGTTEALEVVVHGDAKSSRVVGKRLSAIEMPRGASIGALVRDHEVLMPRDNPIVQAGDHVIVLVTRHRLITKVERVFQVSASFF